MDSMVGGRMMTTTSGYCYECPADLAWRTSLAIAWDIEIYGPTGDEREVGMKTIDGTACIVFLCPDGVYRAVTRVSIGR